MKYNQMNEIHYQTSKIEWEETNQKKQIICLLKMISDVDVDGEL